MICSLVAVSRETGPGMSTPFSDRPGLISHYGIGDLPSEHFARPALHAPTSFPTGAWDVKGSQILHYQLTADVYHMDTFVPFVQGNILWKCVSERFLHDKRKTLLSGEEIHCATWATSYIRSVSMSSYKYT